ncbi:MAG: hypothetical protein JJU13_07840 [Balneolaceae bacterium]|nr:hypothetical protein [Balneolaceae bacterium]
MRTTIDIPDELMKKAKMKAVERGITLKELFTELLESEFQDHTAAIPKAPWKKLKGKGSASELHPADTPFDDYSGPDWVQSYQVNEPD